MRVLMVGGLVAALCGTLSAQTTTGRVVGRVIDASHGRPVSGAQVDIVGVPGQRQTTSGVDGRFSFTDVPAGEVGIRARMIGYGPKLVTGVRVPAQGAVVQDISLNAEVLQLDEVNVTAQAEGWSVAAAISEQRRAVGVMSSVTAEDIARSPDGDAATAVQRVSGVTVQEGKFVFVRGLGERYTTTALNGVRIPSPEPERKVVPFDVFPAGLLAKITTAKTFTPDLPGDFSGAQVDIRTREFPAHRQFTLSTSTGLNTRAIATDVPRAPGESLDWLAFGSRDRPLPDAARSVGGFAPPPSQQTVNAIVSSFRNVWSAPTGGGSPHSSLSLSLGGTDPVARQRIGYLVSGTYSYSQEAQAEQRRAYALPLAEPGQVSEIDRFEGSTGRTSVLLGGLVNLSTLVGSGTRLSLNTSYSRSADNDARSETGESENLGGKLLVQRLRYVERDVWSSQLRGEHRLGSRHNVDWTVSRTEVGRREPDRSEIVYALDTDPTGNPLPPVWFAGSNEGAVRTFAALSERSYEASGNYGITVGSPRRPHQVRFGGLYRATDRVSDNRAYSISANLPRSARELAPESIFDGRFAGAGDGFFRLTPVSSGGSYEAAERLVAGYALLQLVVGDNLELVGGARVERSDVSVTTEPTAGAPVTSTPTYTDVLPSLVVNVRLRDNQTLRVSASQTLSRPEYRELSPVQYREVIGGENVLGNPDLRRSLIQNYDLRWEWYPNPTEVVSVAIFAKRFDSPIERVYLATSGTRIVSFLNAERGSNYGIELETRKNLRVISPALVNFAAHLNATVISSRVRLPSEGLASQLNDERAMVGQAPYVVNAGLSYTSTPGTLSATMLYNVVGRRIVSASEAPLPDSYEEARHLLDLSLRFPLTRGLGGKLDLKNLLDQPFEIRQGTVVREYYRSGRTIAVGLSWQP